MKAGMVITLAAGAAVWSVTAGSEDEWRAFVYPDRNSLARHVEARPFRSLQACRDAAPAPIQANGWAGRADYECGLNCKGKLGGWPPVCDETRR